MQVEGISENIATSRCRPWRVAIFKDEKPDEEFLQADWIHSPAAWCERQLRSEELKGKEGETAYFHLLSADGPKARRLLLVGVGERDQYEAAQISRMAGTAARFLRGKAVKSIASRTPRAMVMHSRSPPQQFREQSSDYLNQTNTAQLRKKNDRSKSLSWLLRAPMPMPCSVAPSAAGSLANP